MKYNGTDGALMFHITRLYIIILIIIIVTLTTYFAFAFDHIKYSRAHMVYMCAHPRQLIFLRKSDCLGCAVLLCLVVVCLTLLASFFFPSHLSLNMYYAYCV